MIVASGVVDRGCLACDSMPLCVSVAARGTNRTAHTEHSDAWQHTDTDTRRATSGLRSEAYEVLAVGNGATELILLTGVSRGFGRD